MDSPVALRLPFTGRWLIENSPARRVPSHGTDLLGMRYAIDFVGVDDRRRTAPMRDWRTFVATEPPERFFAFGRPILAPCDGVVVDVHDGEIDHEARRSQIALVPYALSQMSRYRQGVHALAGNHVIIERTGGAFVALCHLRRGSLAVSVGDPVTTGRQVAECGNSGNSTQPHVHLQATDSADMRTARGIPIVFLDFREWSRATDSPTTVESGMPGERSVVEPLPTR